MLRYLLFLVVVTAKTRESQIRTWRLVAAPGDPESKHVKTVLDGSSSCAPCIEYINNPEPVTKVLDRSIDNQTYIYLKGRSCDATPFDTTRTERLLLREATKCPAITIVSQEHRYTPFEME